MAVPRASLSSRLFCLVIVLGAISHATAFTEIPSDYHQYPDLNVAYKVHKERKTWAAAREACMSEGAHLAIIDSMLKVRKVASLKDFNVYVWVGMSRTGPGASWLSAGNNFLMPNLPWAPGKPSGRHNCLAVRGCNRGLTNENCASLLGFVCQIPLVEDTVTIGAN